MQSRADFPLTTTHRVVYIAHPIKGDLEKNLASIREIVQKIVDSGVYIVPIVPYYVNALNLDLKNIPQWNKFKASQWTAFSKMSAGIDQMWVCGEDPENTEIKELSMLSYLSGVEVANMINGLFSEIDKQGNVMEVDLRSEKNKVTPKVQPDGSLNKPI